MINYEPIEKLHESKQGSSILKVKNKDTGEICALKIIGKLSDKTNRLIFNREVAALKRLNQFDDIVKIFDSDDRLTYKKQGDYGAILLELVNGNPIQQVDFTQYSDLDKIIICRNIASAILHAHQCGILHRDIKPSNIILISDSTRVKVIDFGNSKLKSIVDDETSQHRYTINYVAPEVALGYEFTEKADIYSLGAVFYGVLFSEFVRYNTLKEIYMPNPVIPQFDILLEKMLSHDVDCRVENMQLVVNALDAIVSQLNTNEHSYYFAIDSYKLGNLKKKYIVEDSMTYQQFLKVFLPSEFSRVYGMYHKDNDLYEFIGNNIQMKCEYNSNFRRFEVIELYEIALDKRIKLQRIFYSTDGKLNFIELNAHIPQKNQSMQLSIQLKNYSNERNSLAIKNKLFDELFGKWKESINEAFESIKETSVQIDYSEYWFEQKMVCLRVKDLKGIEIDDLEQDKHFVIESIQGRRIKNIPLGAFENYYRDGDDSILSLSLDARISQSLLKPLLDIKKTIYEDVSSKTLSYKRQLAAISALKNDEYNSSGLKDIILELVEPTSTHSIKSLTFENNKLNNSQQFAVKMAMYSNSISLVQGPPGTGKTSVIVEIIHQVLKKASTNNITPKILIVSQSHTAVDNVLEKIYTWKDITEYKIVRIGRKENVSENVASKHLVDAIKDNMLSNLRSLSSCFIQEKIAFFLPKESDSLDVVESKKISHIKWEEVKKISEDWIARCSDYSSLRYQIVNTATIIAGTCIGFLSDENVREMDFDYVIVDEAAKATTPELLVSIIKAKKIILVGDQNQLPPFADATLSKLAASLVKDPDYRIFDILFESLPDTHKQFLATQYRMCSPIGNLISTVFYDGKIITGVDDKERQHKVTRFMGKSIVWIDTSSLPKHDSYKIQGGSSYNLTEVKIIKNILNEMNNQENAAELDIGIITGYRAQKDSINKAYSNGNYCYLGNVDINTLDAFQGRENDIIIYSTVRTSESIGFQQEKERVNVAFSRARKLLIICGDMKFFETWGGSGNKFVEIVDYIRINTDTCQIISAEEVL